MYTWWRYLTRNLHIHVTLVAVVNDSALRLFMSVWLHDTFCLNKSAIIFQMLGYARMHEHFHLGR
jgi:hypothetical protein